jgi:CDP-diacylglycerol--glycerol-3-phosphate 3-phosphatidyltransferase
LTEEDSLNDSIGKRIPNFLTALRILAVPVFVYLLIDPTPSKTLWATGIFMFASFSDWLDGYIARLYKAESILGTLLDPLADKILVTSALVMLCAAPEPHRVPAWIVVLLLSREFVVTGLRSLAAVKGTVVPASRWAKHKTAWTLLAICCLLIKENYQLFGSLINFYQAGMIFLWIAVIYSIGTGAQYAIALRKMFV